VRQLLILLVIIDLLAVPGFAQAQNEERNQIITRGTGRIELPPDQAVFTLGVQVQRNTAAEAGTEAARIADQMLARLLDLGIRRQETRTSGIQISPLFSSPRDGAPQIVGFRASYTLTLTLRDLTLVGPAIDRAIQAGANSISGVRFGLRDDSQARRDALAAAVRDARAKAEAIAQAAGLQIRGIERIVDEGVDTQAQIIEPRAPMPEMPRMAVPTPVIEPTTILVSAQVTMIFTY